MDSSECVSGFVHRRNERLREALAFLARRADGANKYEVLAHVASAVPPTPDDLELNRSGDSKWETAFLWYTTNLVRAGWLVKDGTGHWRPVAVVDAKYKAERYDGFPNADIYQLLAYCTAYGLPRGHLVYARGNEEPRTYSISAAGVRLGAHCLDLEASPAELLGQVADLAAAIGPTPEGNAL